MLYSIVLARIAYREGSLETIFKFYQPMILNTLSLESQRMKSSETIVTVFFSILKVQENIFYQNIIQTFKDKTIFENWIYILFNQDTFYYHIIKKRKQGMRQADNNQTTKQITAQRPPMRNFHTRTQDLSVPYTQMCTIRK